MTAEEFRQWQEEHRLVSALLTRLEQAEQAILTALDCPIDVVEVYAILNGERPAPWPARTAERDRKRALHAMHALVHIRDVRHHVALGGDNPRLAAYSALLAGMYANDAAANATLAGVIRAHKQSAGKASGQKRRASVTPLLEAVRDYRTRNPQHSRRTIATNLLHKYGGRGTTREGRIKNLAERIRKLETKK